MPSIDFTLPKAFFGIEEGAAGSHFGILPSLGSSERFEMSTKRPELLDVFDKRFTVVREWQGDHPVTGQPTSYHAKQQRIRQWFGWARRGDSQRFIAIGHLQGAQPAT